jgi:cytochrome c oxidase subunit 2
MRLLLGILIAGLLSAAGIYAFLQGRAPDLASQSAEPLATAKDLAKERGCAACHSFDGTIGIGPSWMGSYGHQRTFQDGTTLVADEAYLRESMLQPAARVVTGFQNVMVPVQLSEEDISTFIGLMRDLTQAMPQ